MEPLSKDKIIEAIKYCCEGLDGVDPKAVYMNAHIRFYDGMSTEEIHDTIIFSARDMITDLQPNYSVVAGRLELMRTRKEAFGSYTPPELYQHIKEMCDIGVYHSEIIDKWSQRDIEYFDRRIDHSADESYGYAAMSIYREKYLMQNRVTGKIYESPQIALMLISMCFFQDYPKSARKQYVIRFYNALKDTKLSLPTPIMGGLRSPMKQFSSCVLIEVDDSLSGINAANNAIVRYVSQRAGIGINGGRIRALGSAVRNGLAVHTGCLPFWRSFHAALKSCSQGALRGGAGTLFYPVWHKEVESFLVLKNNKGTEDNRIRHMDYGVQMNGWFLRKALESESKMNLFCPNDVPDMYEAFFADQEEFERLYEKYSADQSIKKKTVKTIDILQTFVQERSSTGRVYPMFVDNVNNHGPFNPEKAPVKQSNLCLEVCLPTSPLEENKPEVGEIALCTLLAWNLGNITYDEFPEIADLSVRAIDALFDYQDYAVKAAEKAKYRRSIGVGVNNYAYWLAKQGLKFSGNEGNNATHELFEKIQYHLLDASAELAGERGACEYFGDTRYADGLLPIDWYKKTVDELHTAELTCDWEALREKIKDYGLRNSTLTAIMPSETSSLILGATNGIEPPRGLVTTKSNKDGVFKVPVPEVQDLWDSYETCWQMEDNYGYLSKVAIMQKFVDQAISANEYHDPFKSGGKIAFKELVKLYLFMYKHGMKTAYYHNTRDMQGEDVEKEDDGCSGGGCKI